MEVRKVGTKSMKRKRRGVKERKEERKTTAPREKQQTKRTRTVTAEE